MNNEQKYQAIFIECFKLTKEQLENNVEYNSIEEWDSIGHMFMIAEIEDNFEISLETEDVIDFSSYNVGKEILNKYGITFHV